MRYKKIKVFIITCLSSCFSYSASTDALNEKLQHIVDQEAQRYNLPALSVSLRLPGETITRSYVSGYTTLAKDHPITSNTLFRMGSITKTFTATIILKLVEEKKLSLDDTLGKLLPEYPRWKTITIKQLLNHSSGIYNYTNGKSFDQALRDNPDKHWLPTEFVEMAYQHEDIFKPGTDFAYCNTEYILLGMIIEKITQQSLQTVFNKYFKTYGLTHTFYTPSGYSNTIIDNAIAHGYNRDGTFSINQDATQKTYSHADGAIVSTPNDLIHWLMQLFDGKIISKSMRTQMLSVISEDNASPVNLQTLKLSPNMLSSSMSDVAEGLGIGLVYFKHYGLVWAHAGGVGGYESFYTVNPCRGVYLALAYSAKPQEKFIFAKIAEDIFAVITAKSKAIENNSNTVILTIERVDDLATKKIIQFKLTDTNHRPITLNDLKTVHTQKMHIFIIDDELVDYSHLHANALGNTGLYEIKWSPTKQGHYNLWVDITPLKTEQEEYVFADITTGTVHHPIIDNHEKYQATVGNYHFNLSFDHVVVAEKPVMGIITVTDSQGKPIKTLEPIMGAFAHIVGFSEKTKHPLHAHPMGKEPTKPSDREGPTLQFHFTPDTSNFIKLFVQVKIDGEELIVPFGVIVTS